MIVISAMGVKSLKKEVRSIQIMLSLLVSGITLASPSIAGSGKATIESSKLAGRKTASGEHYNPNRMVAASKTLPLGTKVKVKNRRTGKSATVTINDREGRRGKGEVDLSKGAAKKLGVKGTAPVQTEVVSKGRK